MKLRRIFFIFILLSVIVCSCKQHRIRKFKKTLFENSATVFSLKNCLDKEIYFIGTHHLGTENYYSSIKNSIDSLHNLGFTLYYEGIYDDTKSKGALVRRMIYKKYKEIMGDKFFNVKEKYKTAADKIEGVIAQPIIDSLGKKPIDICADVSTSQIVEYYEKKYGPVKEGLSQQKNYDAIITDIRSTFRDKHLSNLILTSNHKKIVVLYGSKHKESLIKFLKHDCKNH